MRCINPPTSLDFDLFHQGPSHLPVASIISWCGQAWGKGKSSEVIGKMEDIDEIEKGSIESFIVSFKVIISGEYIGKALDERFIDEFLNYLKIGNPEEKLTLTGMAMRTIEMKGGEKFIDLLVMDKRILEIVNLLMESERIKFHGNGKWKVDCVKANALCLIGTCITKETGFNILSDDLINIILNGVMSDHIGIRGNSYFCIRRGIECNPHIFFDIPNCLDLILVGTLDEKENVVEECLEVLQIILEEDILEDNQMIFEKRDVFESLSKSINLRISQISERVLYEISSKGGMECHISY